MRIRYFYEGWMLWALMDSTKGWPICRVPVSSVSERGLVRVSSDSRQMQGMTGSYPVMATLQLW